MSTQYVEKHLPYNEGDETFIVSNSATCLKCGDSIYSATVHDFRSCKCGAISVDGGQEYIRRLFDEPSSLADTSIIMNKWKFYFAYNTLKDYRDAIPETDATEMMMCVLRSLFNTGCLTVDSWRDVETMLLTYHGTDVTEAIETAISTGRNTMGITNVIVRKVHEAGFLKQ